jgi:nucleoside-diphosphate-sugar epimerase
MGFCRHTPYLFLSLYQIIDPASTYRKPICYFFHRGFSFLIACDYSFVINGVRRAGDSACVTTSIEKIKKALSWQPKYNNLDAIISSALAWEKRKLK